MKEKTDNIEILEDYVEALRKPKPFRYTNEQKAQAIENLISENKELKEENKHLIEINNKYNDMKYITRIAKLYIPKSKVVEELRKAISNEIDLSKAMFEGDFTNGYIFALQSLLEKE